MERRKFWNEPNLSPTEAKLQHYVPQLFLRPFALEKKIRVFDLNESKEYRTSITKAATRHRFYDINVDGVLISTENWLARLEGAATPVLNKLLQNPDNVTSLSVSEEFSIARFLVALRFRSPAFRDQDEKTSASLLQQFKDMAKKQLYHQNDREKADTLWKEIKGKPDHWWFNEPAPPQPAQTTNFMLGEIQGLANLVRAAPWRIGFAPGTIRLYTSDNPMSAYLRPVRPW